MNKLYLIVRNDLEPGLQAAQLVHAAMAFAFQHPERCADWYRDSNNVALLQVPDEPALHAFSAKIRHEKLDVAHFHEEDLNNELTSIALSGDVATRLTSNLPLALRPVRKAA